jgi:hypothetical protein
VTPAQARIILRYAMTTLYLRAMPQLAPYSCVGGPLDGSPAPRQSTGSWPELLYIVIGKRIAVYRLAEPDAKTYLFRFYSRDFANGGEHDDKCCPCGCVRITTSRGPVCCDPNCTETTV